MNYNKQSINEDVYCLTGLLRDKEIASIYSLKIPTIRYWKNKTLDDFDSWKRITYELLVRYIADKDIYSKNTKRNSDLDIKKNLTSLEIGEKEYESFKFSPKDYKIFMTNLIEFTPSEIFKKRILFLKECIDSIDKRCINNIYNNTNSAPQSQIV